jgi:hypothetical protein
MMPFRSPKLVDPLSLILHRHNLGDSGYLVLPTPCAWSEALVKEEQTPETSALPETDLCKRSFILLRFWTADGENYAYRDNEAYEAHRKAVPL